MSKLTVRLLNSPLPVRRAVALLMAMAVGAAIAMSVYLAIASISHERAHLLALREELGQKRQIASLKPALLLRDAQLASVTSEGFFSGETEAEIKVALQRRVEEIASQCAIAVSSLGNAPSIVAGDITYAGFKVDFSGPIEAVHSAVLSLETSTPQIIIDEISLWQAGGEFQPGGTAPPQIGAQIILRSAVPPTASTKPQP